MSAKVQVSVEERGLTLAEPVLLTLKKPEPFVNAARRRWWVLAFTAGIGGIVAIIVAFNSTAWYQSFATFAVLPIDDPTAPSQFDSISSAPPLFTNLLESRRVEEQVVAKLNLTDSFGKKTPEDARVELHKRMSVSIDRKANIVTLGIEDTIPARAREIAQAVSDVGRQVNAEIWSAKATEHRKRLEARLADVSKALNEAEEAMRVFREREQIVDLNEQIKASVGEAAYLSRLKNEKKIGLNFAQSFGGAEAPEVKRGQLEAGSANRALQGLVHGGGGPLLPLDKLPQLQEEHSRLKREIDNNAALQEVLVRQVEQVRAVEARPGGRVELVDAPFVPRVRSRPSRSGFALEGAFLGLVLGLIYVGWPRIRYAAENVKFPRLASGSAP